MNQDLFYVFGLALVVAAVLIAVVGLRAQRFPTSKAVLALGTGLFIALVVATGTFAWLSAEDEQDHREAELAEAAEQNVAEGDEGEAAEEVGSEVAVDEAAESVAAVDGATVFEGAGCGGCHTLADAGSTGATGPDLDETLAGQSPAYIEEAIVDPNATIAAGFPADVMPQTYGEEFSPEELTGLVDYLSESTGGQG
jgi:mono/diheme cytochrome c family protein